MTSFMDLVCLVTHRNMCTLSFRSTTIVTTIPAQLVAQEWVAGAHSTRGTSSSAAHFVQILCFWYDI